MVRCELKKMEEFRGCFTGIFERYGIKTGWRGVEIRTILLKDIHDEKGRIITDHLWFNNTKGFQALNLRGGELIQFHARVKPYIRGYRDYNIEKQIENPLEIDYKLSYPTRFKILPKKRDKKKELNEQE